MKPRQLSAAPGDSKEASSLNARQQEVAALGVAKEERAQGTALFL